jgi:hypothetical protein
MCGRRWSIRPQPDYALHRATVQSRPNPRGGTELQDKYQTWLAWGRPLLAWLCNGRLRAREGGLLFRMSHGRARRWFGSWLHRANFLAVGPTVIRHVTKYSGESWGLSSGGFEETWLAIRKLDSQSRFSTFGNVCRFDFAALYTLQHGLTGDAKRAGSLLHGDESLTG